MITIDETLLYSDYNITEIRKSEINPDTKIVVEIGMTCPRCKTTLESMNHGEDKECPHCGIEMILHGNRLRCVVKEDYNDFKKRMNKKEEENDRARNERIRKGTE